MEPGVAHVLLWEETNEESELWGRARVPKKSAQFDRIFDILWSTSTSSKKNCGQFDQFLNISGVSTEEFRWNMQDSKIIVKKILHFLPNSRPRSYNSFSSFNPPRYTCRFYCSTHTLFWWCVLWASKCNGSFGYIWSGKEKSWNLD